jgi:hypothetical protein
MKKIFMIQMEAPGLVFPKICTQYGFWTETEEMDAIQEAIHLNQFFEQNPVEGIGAMKYSVIEINKRD